MPTFTWTPDFSAKRTVKPVVTPIKFGDGYEQRATYGINTKPENWSLKFSNRDDSEADAIEAFFEAQGGVDSFDWTPPLGIASLKFVCRTWDRSLDKANLNTVTATLEQVFEP